MSEIAAQVGAHPRTLNRAFAKYVGMTVQEYRSQCRLAQAGELRAGRDLKMAAVAAVVGIGRSTLFRLMSEARRGVRGRHK